MISLLLLFIAAFFNAVMDATENKPKFDQSIFKKLPVQFWLKEQSWKYAAKIFGYHLDAWHIAKSGMVICFVCAIIFFNIPVHKWQDVAFYLAIDGITWNLSFWLFYNVIFKVK